jgi:hypothetical protein
MVSSPQFNTSTQAGNKLPLCSCLALVCPCSQKKLGSVSDELTHHATCNTIIIKVSHPDL